MVANDRGLVGVVYSGGSSAAGMDDAATYAEEHGPDEGYDAEFDGDSLPAGWSLLNGGASVVTVAHSMATLTPERVADRPRIVARTVPSETHWIADAKLLAVGRSFSGLILVDDAGADVLTAGWYHGGNQLASERRSYTAWVGLGLSPTGDPWDFQVFGSRPDYWRMEFNAGIVNVSLSADGFNWVTPESTAFDSSAHVVSPSHVGFFCSELPGWDMKVSCDWFRIRTP